MMFSDIFFPLLLVFYFAGDGALHASCLGTLVARMQARLSEAAAAGVKPDAAKLRAQEVRDLVKALGVAGGIIVVGVLYVPVTVFNAVGETWEWAPFYIVSIGIELALLAYILRSVWMWPRTASRQNARS